jgi:hypothetical protein
MAIRTTTHRRNVSMSCKQPVVRTLTILLTLTLLIAARAPFARAEATRAVLPEGPAKPALDFPHFPSRLHAFVWRNWGLVEPRRLADVLGTPAENVTAIAISMGLSPEPTVPPEMLARGYATLIRRNWHLLPYDQLLQLLDMTPDRLAYLLREDDFLWVKLGQVKPRCERLTYAPPDDAARRRAAEIKAFVEREFGDALRQPGEARFAFLRQFERPVDDPPLKDPAARIHDGLRLIYSYPASYGDPLADPKLDPYPDTLLRDLAAQGINGVWMHVVLRDLAPGGPDFPEFGAGHEQRLRNLAHLAQRARRFGVGVYLYLNEPRAMPAAFFKDRPELAGVREWDFAALCTSDPRVRRWLTDATARIFHEVPDLAGVLTITASENLTSCASHRGQQACPRCRDRDPADILAEVNAAIEAGVHRGSPDARVIAWDWGWPDDAAPRVIERLPKSVWLQSVSEWSLPITRGGVRTTVGEYSLSAVGPGPRATRHWALARAAGLRTSAKVQVNNTWELSAVPYLPVMDLIAEHCDKLSTAGVDGLMLSWTLGGYPSPNLEIVHRLTAKSGKKASRDEVLDTVARERFGPAGAPHARRAWTLFSDAMREYPYSGQVVYNCPVQLGPANLLYPKPTGYAATMVGFPYDDVKAWSGPYGPAVLASQFDKVAAGWERGLKELAAAADAAPPDRLPAARADLGIARAAGLHFRSVANQTRFILARDALTADPAPTGDTRDELKSHRRAAAADELANARALFALASQDSRIGFEASNHYYYVPLDLVEKAINCRYVLDHP